MPNSTDHRPGLLKLDEEAAEDRHEPWLHDRLARESGSCLIQQLGEDARSNPRRATQSNGNAGDQQKREPLLIEEVIVLPPGSIELAGLISGLGNHARLLSRGLGASPPRPAQAPLQPLANDARETRPVRSCRA
jgi:hypothetical protein